MQIKLTEELLLLFSLIPPCCPYLSVILINPYPWSSTYSSKMPALISMAACKTHTTHSPFFEYRFQETFGNRNGYKVSVKKAKLSEKNVKKANLSASRKERIKIPKYGDCENSIYHTRHFMSDSAGIEAILNSKALQSYQSLDSNLYRCILPQVRLLNFEVAPVIDLQVTPTAQDCVVEMISCKFEGSDVVESQNEHFSASMQNSMKWETIGSEQFLDVDVRLNLVLEIYTQPFAVLPTSTVEGPGNIMMQALVDQLLPLFLQQLLQNYEDWVSQRRKFTLSII